MDKPKRMIQHDADEEVYETDKINDDFDQINQEKMVYSKFTGTTYTQQSQYINLDPVNAKTSQQVFQNESTQSMHNRFTLQKSRQT